MSKDPLLGKTSAKIVPARNAPKIGSISNKTESPTTDSIRANDPLIPISSGSFASNNLLKSSGYHHAALLSNLNNRKMTMKYNTTLRLFKVKPSVLTTDA